jgi:hypothetical protein
MDLYRGAAARDIRETREVALRQTSEPSWGLAETWPVAAWDQAFAWERARPGWNGMVAFSELLAHAELANRHAAVDRWRGLPRRTDALRRWRGLAED